MILPEASRLSSLKLYRILDTAAESTFDGLTELASTICETPISLISLVDETRQWFKSRHGLDSTETPRSHAFCAHALKDEQLLIVEDALEDSRFHNNPLVSGNLNIRFYAGAPLLMADGAVLGTLCVIDTKPRGLSDTQTTALSILRDAVVTQIELRRALDDLNATRKLLLMCAWCRSVRTEDSDPNAAWTPLHEYVAEASAITHGMCPSCEQKAVSDLEKESR